MSELYRIVHLSDMHFSKKNKNDPVYKSVKLSISDLKPDIIVVTGDIADNMRPQINPDDFEVSLLIAHKFLLEICQLCNIDHNKRLFIVPGNHDYRYGGNLPRSKYPNLFKKYLSSYFKTDVIN